MQARVRTARCRAKESSDRIGFTIVELLVVMTVLMTLLALALPAVTRVRATARKTICINHLRNIALALTQFDHFNGRLPASGYYYDPPGGGGGPHHSWAVSILPFVEQQNLYNQWDQTKLITDSENQLLSESYVEVYVCPMDISRSDEQLGDLSYAVNGGWGFTIRTSGGVGDCPMDWHGRRLDLNGDGQTCTGTAEVDDRDRELFKRTGLFFLENWKLGGTERHHSIGAIHDGTTQTFLVTENVRTGYSPDSDQASFADPNPYRSAFYIGNPCRIGVCSPGNIDYSQCNSGEDRINSGLWRPEGQSPVPNSFHAGGVNMAYADAHVTFLAETVDGAVYAALVSPQGILLRGTPLEEVIVSGGAP